MPSADANIREDLCVLNLQNKNSSGVPVYVESTGKGTTRNTSYSKKLLSYSTQVRITER